MGAEGPDTKMTSVIDITVKSTIIIWITSCFNRFGSRTCFNRIGSFIGKMILYVEKIKKSILFHYRLAAH